MASIANQSGWFASELLPDQGGCSSQNPDRLTVFASWCQIKADTLRRTDWSGSCSPWPTSQDALPVNACQIKADALQWSHAVHHGQQVRMLCR
ncbi:MAG: hypothetical protein WCS87_03985 [Methylococcaceae bacterium]